MSKLAELLQSRGIQAVASATQEQKSSDSSNSSGGSPAKRAISPTLEQRIRSMAARWGYSTAEQTEVLDLAYADPEKWAQAVALDERRERAFRGRNLMPGSDA
jgi:hypothetical protein